MLGQSIADPLGVEGPPGSSEGLGWLPIATTMQATKTLCRTQGVLRLCAEETPVSGYEIHNGVSDRLTPCQQPFFLDGERADGCLSEDGQVLGTYLHGLFDTPAACAALLAWAGYAEVPPVNMHQVREQALERLADTLASTLDLAALDRLLGTSLFPTDGVVGDDVVEDVGVGDIVEDSAAEQNR